MKRRIILSIVLVLSIGLLSLTSSDSTAQAQRNRTYVYDSGMVIPGPNQILIGLLLPAFNVPTETTFVRVRKRQYAQGLCNGSRCTLNMEAESTDEFSLGIGEGASVSVALATGSSAVQIVFTSSNPNLRVNGQLIDTVTGAVLSIPINDKN